MTRACLFMSIGLSFALAACAGDEGDDTAGSAGSETSASGSTSADSSTTTSSTTASTSATGDSTSSSGGVDTGSSEAGSESESGSGSTGGGDGSQVTFETTLGNIVIQLDPVAAPITSANFLAYVEAGFYDGADGDGSTIFHRVIPGFVIQGGGLREDMSSKPTMPPIVNEFGNGLTNVRGAISMARTSDPDSATSQFFINVVDNANLDIPPGYAVFGMVVEGMEVVDMIVAVPTTTMGPYEDVPVEPIPILSATVQ